jgi:hypothetical protein
MDKSERLARVVLNAKAGKDRVDHARYVTEQGRVVAYRGFWQSAEPIAAKLVDSASKSVFTLPKKPVFDFRAHFCHSAPMETHVSGFRRQRHGGPKAISYQLAKRSGPARSKTTN